MHILKWFKNRIGKRIYRDDDGCNCETCKDVVKTGLTIRDEQHAQYIYDIQNGFADEEVYLNYRDKKTI